jgi:hypothetical protein
MRDRRAHGWRALALASLYPLRVLAAASEPIFWPLPTTRPTSEDDPRCEGYSPAERAKWAPPAGHEIEGEQYRGPRRRSSPACAG